MMMMIIDGVPAPIDSIEALNKQSHPAFVHHLLASALMRADANRCAY